MFEIVYSLFLLSGVIKSFLIAIFKLPMPVDFTLLMALVLVLVYLPKFIRDGVLRSKFSVTPSSLPLIGLLSVFFLWMITTLTFTPSPRYSFEKVFLFLPNLVAFILPLLYVNFKTRRFLKFHVFFSTGLSLLFAYYYPRILQFELHLDDPGFAKGYLTIGYISGLTAALLIFLDFGLKKSVRLVLVLLNIFVMMIAGGRGPLFFLVLVLLLKGAVMITKIKKIPLSLSPKKILLVILAVILIVFATQTVIQKYAHSLERSLYRLSLLFDAGSDDSVSTRLSYIDFSFDKIFQDVGNFAFGCGIGSFGILYSGEDVRQYPHNILLEIWFELGVMGLFLFLLFMAFYFKKVQINSPLLYPFIYIVLNSLKSSSFTDLRIMFGFFCVFLLYDALVKREAFEKEETA